MRVEGSTPRSAIARWFDQTFRVGTYLVVKDKDETGMGRVAKHEQSFRVQGCKAKTNLLRPENRWSLVCSLVCRVAWLESPPSN